MEEAGIEPATFGMQHRRSPKLSYSPVEVAGPVGHAVSPGVRRTAPPPASLLADHAAMLPFVFRFRRLPRTLMKRVVVHTKDEHSIEGVLIGEYVDCLVLAHASFFGGEAGVMNIEGDQIILNENVSFIQELPPGPPTSA